MFSNRILITYYFTNHLNAFMTFEFIIFFNYFFLKNLIINNGKKNYGS